MLRKREKSIDNIHLDHIKVFANAERRRVGMVEEGLGFLSPTPPLLFSLLSFFPHRVSSLLVLTASLCHISEDPLPVSQSSQRTARMSSLHPPPRYLLALLFGLFFLSLSLQTDLFFLLVTLSACCVSGR